MPDEGKYLLVEAGFSLERQSYITLYKDGFIRVHPRGKTMTLAFDTSHHSCIGWRDMATGERFACPDNAQLEAKYEQCPACQNRTGFNPAFYNATSVSKQQEERNLKPHFLYLAHFGKGVMKVGISFARRKHSRLLEQGARAALILETFPTAHIARQYEAEIAKLPGIVETLQIRKKIALATTPYNATLGQNELMEAKAKIEQHLGKTFSSSDPLIFDQHYFPGDTPDFASSYDCSPHDKISGTAVGALGSLFFFSQHDTPLFIPLKKYIGCHVDVSYTETPIDLPARQISLF